MSGRVSQCCKSAGITPIRTQPTPGHVSVGLSIDCSRWVRAGIITHDEMLDRNWAHWDIFAMVRFSACLTQNVPSEALI